MAVVDVNIHADKTPVINILRTTFKDGIKSQ